MEEQRYLISEASRKTGTEAHVLRYWEEELALKIPRRAGAPLLYGIPYRAVPGDTGIEE